MRTMLAACLAMFLCFPAVAQEGMPTCYAKDQVIDLMVSEGKAIGLPISHKKLSAVESDSLTELMISNAGLEPARSYVLFWTDSENGDPSVVAITRFDVHNCYSSPPIQTSRALVAHLIAEPEA